MISVKNIVLGGLLAAHSVLGAGPFFTKLNNITHILGNDLWNITVNGTHGRELFYKGQDLVKDAAGVYFSHSGRVVLSWTNASIYSQTPEYLDVVFAGDLGDFHWVIKPELEGAYQYFVNRNLSLLGEFRTLTRLDNVTFTRARNSEIDVELPSLSTIVSGTNVSDETWLLSDGSYVTKYNFATFIREETAYGAYGDGFGVWYIVQKDDYNGDHLKQELTFHRESKTGDTVLLNMLHGTHFQALSADIFDKGKIWGPWLWYLNDGTFQDAEARAKKERSAYPYQWFNDTAYQSRGSVSGTLLLSDGRPASGAAVFLGDNNSTISSLDQGRSWYYTTYADENGIFGFEQVRTGTYGLRAWPNGGIIGDVTTTYAQNDVVVEKDTNTGLEHLHWQTQDRKKIWQIGDVDRKSRGFQFAGAQRQHALMQQCPANLTVVPSPQAVSEWCYGQAKNGTWTVAFDIEEDVPGNSTAVLSVSLAGYSAGTSSNITVNDVLVGNMTSGVPGLKNDPSMYQSANLAGEWRYFEFGIGAGLLKSGANDVSFTISNASLWRGFLWDSILLEWA